MATCQGQLYFWIVIILLYNNNIAQFFVIKKSDYSSLENSRPQKSSVLFKKLSWREIKSRKFLVNLKWYLFHILENYSIFSFYNLLQFFSSFFSSEWNLDTLNFKLYFTANSVMNSGHDTIGWIKSLLQI